MGDFYVYTSLAGMLLSVIIMIRGSWFNNANLFLGAFFWIISFIVLIFSFEFKGHPLFWTALLMGNSVPFYYLLGPFSYFYIRSLINDTARLKPVDLLHFALFFIQILLMLPHYFSSWEHKMVLAGIFQDGDGRQLSLNLSYIPDILNTFLGALQLCFYLIWNILIWKRFKERGEIKLFNNISFKFTEKWIVFFLSIVGLHILNSVLLAVSEIYTPSRIQFMSEQSAFVKYAGLFLLIIIVGLLSFPEIMYGIPRIKARVNVDDLESSELLKAEEAKQDREAQVIVLKSSKIEFSEVEEKLDNIVHQSQAYLKNDFTIHKLAMETGVPLHHLRFYFSRNASSFANFKNKLKVSFAKNLLVNSAHDKLNIEGIGRQAGFISSSSFFAEFKKETGFTPTEFVRNLEHVA